MNKVMVTPILELVLTDLSAEFDSIELEVRARSQLHDLESLLKISNLLTHTKLIYAFRADVNEKEAAVIVLIVGLALRNQAILDFENRTLSAGQIEQFTLDDRQRMVGACRALPTLNASAAMGLAQRLSRAYLNLPEASLQPRIEEQINVLMRSKRRHWNGQLTGNPWQHQLPALPKHEWLSEHVNVRAQLHREKRGFSLTLLRRHELPASLSSAKQLRMLERPACIDMATILDRAEYTGSPIDMVIRLGRRIGAVELTLADFVCLPSADRPQQNELAF